MYFVHVQPNYNKLTQLKAVPALESWRPPNTSLRPL